MQKTGGNRCFGNKPKALNPVIDKAHEQGIPIVYLIQTPRSAKLLHISAQIIWKRVLWPQGEWPNFEWKGRNRGHYPAAAVQSSGKDEGL
ncbi:hypothetical protein PO124_30525 [Bacillus licheniformis]|nr:hypothetical protein [Bacillus licheniformis]